MTATDDFPITWVEPDDAELTWEWDDMHMPTAVTPLAGDYNLLMGAGFAYGYERLSVPYEVLTRVWNNYTYFALAEARPRLRERRGRRALHGGPAGRHRRRPPPTGSGAVAELRDTYDWIAARPVETAERPTWPRHGTRCGGGSAGRGASTSTRSAARTR